MAAARHHRGGLPERTDQAAGPDNDAACAATRPPPPVPRSRQRADGSSARAHLRAPPHPSGSPMTTPKATPATAITACLTVERQRVSVPVLTVKDTDRPGA